MTIFTVPDLSGGGGPPSGPAGGDLAGVYPNPTVATVGGATAAAISATVTGGNMNYLILAGVPGGQTAVGGTLALQQLNLRGSAAADLGRVEVQSPLEVANVAAGDQVAIRYRPTFTTGAPFIGGMIQASPTLTYDNPTFIWALLADLGVYQAAVAPGFSGFTLFNALSTIQNSGNFDLVQALVLNVGVVHSRITAGTSTTTQTVGMAFSPQTRTTIAGATMTRSVGMTAIQCLPTYSTVLGSTVNMGTVTGLRCDPPAIALFGAGAGTNNLAAYYGLDFAATTFPTTGVTVVVRSAMTDSASRFFLQNNGGARSSFGGGSLLACGTIQINTNNTNLDLGTGANVGINWNGTALEFDPVVGDDLRFSFAAGVHTIQSASFGTTAELRMGFTRFAFGQTTAVGNQVGIFVAGVRSTATPGEWADFLLTQGGALTTTAALSTVAGWKINAPSITLGGGGSVVDGCALYVSGNVNQGTGRFGLLIDSNPTGGTTNHPLRVRNGISSFNEAQVRPQTGVPANDVYMTFLDGTNTYEQQAGTVDPSAGGGVAAPVGSTFQRNAAGVGQLWVKTGAAATAWTQVI